MRLEEWERLIKYCTFVTVNRLLPSVIRQHMCIQVGFIYTWQVNRSKRKGQLWHGKFVSCTISASLLRYIFEVYSCHTWLFAHFTGGLFLLRWNAYASTRDNNENTLPNAANFCTHLTINHSQLIGRVNWLQTVEGDEWGFAKKVNQVYAIISSSSSLDLLSNLRTKTVHSCQNMKPFNHNQIPTINHPSAIKHVSTTQPAWFANITVRKENQWGDNRKYRITYWIRRGVEIIFGCYVSEHLDLLCYLNITGANSPDIPFIGW